MSCTNFFPSSPQGKTDFCSLKIGAKTIATLPLADLLDTPRPPKPPPSLRVCSNNFCKCEKKTTENRITTSKKEAARLMNESTIENHQEMLCLHAISFTYIRFFVLESQSTFLQHCCNSGEVFATTAQSGETVHQKKNLCVNTHDLRVTYLVLS
jgi:hypothetical protein